jgi:DNA-directed RNA polymerase subunit E'/Rpb7
MSTVIIRKPIKKQIPPAGQKSIDHKIFGVYMKSILDKKVCLSITEIGKNVKQNLEYKILNEITGKCINEGYIKPGSVNILNFSSGNVQSNVIEFKVIFECMVCLPVEGMLVECVCKTITKAGIHAQVIDDDGNIPIIMFVARDHHHLDHRFNAINEGEQLTVKVIGVRYELHDKYVCTIGKLI